MSGASCQHIEKVARIPAADDEAQVKVENERAQRNRPVRLLFPRTARNL